MSFATLQEAWGVPTFGVEESKPVAKQPAAQAEVLERTESSQRSLEFVTNYLRDVHQRHGIAGVMSLLDEQTVKDLRMAALLSFDWLDTNSMLFIFMCLCALWLLIDMLGRK